MAPLTSCLVSGVFAIEGGRRETEKPFYATYLSTLDFVDPENFLDVSVRNYSPLHSLHRSLFDRREDLK